MRVILTCREALAPFHQPILERLTAILVEISKNPSNPRFSQFCFESISALIRCACCIAAALGARLADARPPDT